MTNMDSQVPPQEPKQMSYTQFTYNEYLPLQEPKYMSYTQFTYIEYL